MSAPARRSFWAEFAAGLPIAAAGLVSRTCCKVASPASLVSPDGPAGAAVAPAEPEPEACGLDAASGAAPVATGVVGGAAG